MLTLFQPPGAAARLGPCWAMSQFNPNPFRGEASVPHVSETFFKVYFAAAQVCHAGCPLAVGQA